MKRTLSLTLISVLALMLAITGCKYEKNDDPGILRIDISDLTRNLATPASSTSSRSSQGVVTPDSQAQTPVRTLLIAPLSFSNHGKPYNPDEPVTDAIEKDLEDDAANSANLVQLVTLPTEQDYVEIEVPTISEGWQLLAAASTKLLENADDLGTDNNVDTLVYVGFSKEAFTSAEEFNNANVSLEMKRNCFQKPAPLGCATFDDNHQAIVTSGVEIHGITINNQPQTLTNSPPWVVRESPLGADEELASTVAGYMNSVISAFGTSVPITSIEVSVTHQLSNGKSTECATTTTDYINLCGVQINKRVF